MNSTHRQAGNPFCTRCVRPGALPFAFLDGQNVDILVDRLKQNRWWGQIVGPHGSGKSTLLATLMPAIERQGRRVVLIELHDGQRRLPQDAIPSDRHPPPTVLVVDGYEQLARWNRWMLKRHCRRLGMGLLVTSHVSVRLPLLCRTSVSVEVAEQVVRQLLAGRTMAFSRDEIAACLDRHGQDLREALFDLYDRYEQR